MRGRLHPGHACIKKNWSIPRWTARVLEAWSKQTCMKATTLIIGHNTMFVKDVATKSFLRVHSALRHSSGGSWGQKALCYAIPAPPTAEMYRQPHPWINASVNKQGVPIVWRLDVAASRSWWTVADVAVWPQVLELCPLRGEAVSCGWGRITVLSFTRDGPSCHEPESK